VADRVSYGAGFAVAGGFAAIGVGALAFAGARGALITAGDEERRGLADARRA
jgi:hypothetical protein